MSFVLLSTKHLYSIISLHTKITIEKSDFLTILFFISCIIACLFGILCCIAFNYKELFIETVNKSIDNSVLTDYFKDVIKKFYLNKRPKHISNVGFLFLILWTITSIANTYYLFSFFDSTIYEDIFFTIVLTVFFMAISSIFLDYIAMAITYKLAEPDIEAILSKYFTENYPEIKYLFVPVYSILANPSKREELNGESKPNFFTTTKATVFGTNLVKFTTLFEKAIQDDNAEKVFKAETLKSDNVSLLAKMVVLLSDPLLKEQLVSNEFETAKEFNSLFGKMVEDLEQQITNMQKLDAQLKTSEQELKEQKEAQQVRDHFDFIIKQKFN